jgi:demethylmenaquinone methyltransferase/2-methoxy-6-polyprenyl-1,4-benzoquinol methylase
MNSDPRINLVESLFSGTGTTYDLIVNLFTGGVDKLWKGKMLAQLPTNPQRVVDLAAGTGIVTFAIARRYPNCQVIGVELRAEYMDIGRARATRDRIDNVEFVLSRAEDVQLPHTVDAITSSYLAKYADLPRLAHTMHQMLRPGGLIVAHEFTYPTPAVLGWTWEVYMFFLRIVGSRLFPQWSTIFQELPGLIRHTTWVEDMTQALEAEGFVDIHFERLTLGGAGLITARKAATT